MTTPLERAFEACWSAMLQGESLEACLGRYPNLSDELRPLLTAALQAHERWDVRSDAAHASHSRSRVLQQAAALRRTARNRSGPISLLARPLAFGLALLLAIVLGGTGLFGVSAQSLPGDNLYSIKLAIERVRMDLSFNTSTQLSLAAEFERRRIDEIKKLLQMGRVARVQFDGRLDSISGDLYTVEGVHVLATAATRRSQDLRPGDYVAVAGNTHSARWVLAASIRLAGQQFQGTVDQMGASAWTVSGRSVRLAPDTQIDLGIGLGDRVTVQLHTRANLTVAAAIHLISRATPTPVLATPEPTVLSPTIEPTEAAPSQEIEHEQATETPEKESPESVTFTGKVTSKSASQWVVDGRSVSITSETETDGGIQVGDKVEVRAIPLADGTFQAERIRKVDSSDGGGTSEEPGGEDFEFTGRVDSISASAWVIDGRTVKIETSTEIDGSPQTGDTVHVTGFTSSDGSRVADKIEKQHSESEGEGSGSSSDD
jgi:hypothetical protein